jgi:membrane-bound lytic murein transglycosylase D
MTGGPSAAPGAQASKSTSKEPSGRLESAREEYYQGVKAYVREDFEEAESRFVSSIALLEAPLPSDFATATELEEAETLLTKSNYFLQKISDREVAEIEIPETQEEVAPPPSSSEVVLYEETPADWEVRGEPIVPVRNDMVDKWMNYFRGDGRRVYQTWLNRRTRYQAIYNDAFARYQLPQELTYHSMIESGFSHRAYSWAHAVGLWQFIKSTGRLYGLRADWWVDERRDPVKATDAAARYLRALYDEFGSWELALAAYNVGEGSVRRQINRQGTRNFWKLRLPRETRNHVPKFYAAMIIAQNPEQYGFTVTPELPYATEIIEVDWSVDFEMLGKCCGVSEEALAELNPSLLRRCTPPNEKGFPVYIPAGAKEKTLAALAAIPEEQRNVPRVEFVQHRVRRGETLSKIAQKYGTTVSAIVEANKLGSRNRVSAGRYLTIPGTSASDRGTQVASSSPSRKSSRSKGPSGSQKVTYVVKSGDTLSRIAESHGVSTTALRRWNQIGRHIRPGDRLAIYVKGGAVATKSSGDSKGSGSSTVVRVRRGDTLWDIARSNGVSLSDLLIANNMKTSARIKPGDRIRIPSN